MRGCIGTFDQSRKLSKVLKEYALISSQEDDRFGPISLKELPNLQVAVSLLVNFKHLPNDKLLNGWTVGKHGIEISFEADDYYSATFLPEVAEEEGWDQ